MTPGAAGDRNQAVRAFFHGFLGETVVDDVMQGDAAVAVHRFVDPFLGTQGGNHNGGLVLDTHFHVVLQPGIGAVHDLVDRIGRRGIVWVFLVVTVQFVVNALQPFIQHRFRARIQGRKGADDTGFALGNDQIRIGNDE